MKEKYILGITAHPDDHISFAGTVLKLQKQGYRYAEIVLSRAEESGMIKEGERLISVDKKDQEEKRSKEFSSAVRLLKIDPVYQLDLPNIGVSYEKETALELMRIIRALQPEMLFIHHPDDYMNDHIQASYLGLEAAKIASYSFRLDLGKNWRTPKVLYFEGVNPINAEVLVDITDEYNQKLEILKIYGSQFDDRGFQLVEGTSRYRGYPRRTQRAEAFEVPKNYPLWEI
ncbi:MAG: hypothetical protein COU06_01905 [Candidatus Harrisonbacteria bacterium CG10_big_fil_rev_8_21_14_0_10_38_8]|uniref:PIG-L family deacetylase n=1 Tax=Candidatus Harrisonbacteria bacterium CG10_big_fil_rev_8_21_14_0_10_38_8 TaxID=1974582 RepID=A0A2M6WJV2_9BACT|nr:MAG: hypothetical protein COU06_01905 [Candidatus Harrisonbacteria bacterium CG10_big_fil_rev_8_21_14_0_10_38_8]